MGSKGGIICLSRLSKICNVSSPFQQNLQICIKGLRTAKFCIQRIRTMTCDIFSLGKSGMGLIVGTCQQISLSLIFRAGKQDLLNR